MDLKGQKLAETSCLWIVTAAAVLAFLWGYLRQDFQAMVTLFGGGCALAFVACVPDWPLYNRHPIKWLPPKEAPPAAGAPRRGGGGSAGNLAGGRKKAAASWSNLWGMF